MALVSEVYALTYELPKNERFGLISQIRRSAVSIPSCIAEGSRRNTRKDYAHFLKIAEGSSMELETQLILVEQLFSIKTDNYLNSLEEIQKMLSVMISKLIPRT